MERTTAVDKKGKEPSSFLLAFRFATPQSSFLLSVQFFASKSKNAQTFWTSRHLEPPLTMLAVTTSRLVTQTGAAADLLCFSHLRWDFVYQRPQHLLTRCAKERRVFFWEEPIIDVSPGAPAHLEIVQRDRNVWIVRPHLSANSDAELAQKILLRSFLQEHRVHRFVRWYYTPMALAFSSDLDACATVYDCMDELSAFLGAPPELLSREQDLLRVSDVVFTGGLSLYEAKRVQHDNVHAYPSSIDREHFAQVQGHDPVDQASIPHPRAGFFGVLDERFDQELVRSVARLRPDIQFVLIGPVAKIDPASLPQAPNIHYLGAKTYDELPAYLAQWDVALIPFARNESTRFISPTKTPEYLAAGKPVVSTSIRDVVRSYGKAGLAGIADLPEDFAEAIDQALEPRSEVWRAAVDAKLALSSWDRTWAAMWNEVNRVLVRKSRETSAIELETLPQRKLRPVALQPRPAKPVYDYLIVGAGFAGAVMAERLARGMNKRVLLIDKREHVAGNAFDFHDNAGILVHRYGPHIFHTNHREVFEYLSQFTEWHPYVHRVLASVDGMLVPIPINLDTINSLYGLSLDAEGMQTFLQERIVEKPLIRTSEDIVISRVGRDLYEKFFRNYTRKQWGLDPSQLDSSVAGRIPVRFDRDDRYFADKYQAMPKHGYTRMFERMLDHPKIEIQLGTEFRQAASALQSATTIFTGPIDEFFAYRFGPLPYRSLQFRHETVDREVFQAAPVVNYPNDHAYTRITEFKQLTGQTASRTSIVYEFPMAQGDPYYPIPRPENAAIYARYKELSEQRSDVIFVGRLANYRYYNMDQVVAQALQAARGIQGDAASNTARRAPVSAMEQLIRPAVGSDLS